MISAWVPPRGALTGAGARLEPHARRAGSHPSRGAGRRVLAMHGRPIGVGQRCQRVLGTSLSSGTLVSLSGRARMSELLSAGSTVGSMRIVPLTAWFGSAGFVDRADQTVSLV